MPTYESVLLVQKLERSGLKEVLKRAANYIFEAGGTLRSMENLGLRTVPYVIKSNGKKHSSAHYFIFSYDIGREDIKKIKEKCNLDLEILKTTNFMTAKDIYELHEEKKTPECTLYLDLLPAPYRPTVIALQQLAKKKKKKNTHKNYEDTDFLLY